MRSLEIIWSMLTPALRRRFITMQCVSLLMASSTVVALAAVMSFLAVLANPAFLESHAAMNWLTHSLAVTRANFPSVMGGGFVALILVSMIANIAGSRATARFAFAAGDRIREVLFAEYLQRNYRFHAEVGAGRLTDHVLNLAGRITMTLMHGQQLVTNASLTLLVVVSIAIVDLRVAAMGALVMTSGYLLFYRLIRRRIGRHGRLQAELSSRLTADVEQAFLGIKYLQISGAQSYFRRRFAASNEAISQSVAETQFLGQLPRYVIEGVAGVALIMCAAMSGDGSLWLAQLSFIGFAGFRLLPAFQQMYLAFVVIRSSRESIEEVTAQFARGGPSPITRPSRPLLTETSLSKGIDLIKVSFRYSAGAPCVLDHASLRIPAGAVTCIVGASGCGKTTLVDLVLGILSGQQGRIEIDGVSLDASLVMAWQQRTGYVPQHVVVLDATVRENIAFGVDPEEIDDARVRDAAVRAGASQFIEALPEKYLARISGVDGRLSGGQRQRIAIARALYQRPSLLVLDEATGALDADSERAIIDAVIRNRGRQTLLVVAHSRAVIDACDFVHELRGGGFFERAPAPPIRLAERARRSAE